jgi:hypothetical protein
MLLVIMLSIVILGVYCNAEYRGAHLRVLRRLTNGSGENVQGYFRFFSPFPRISVFLKKVLKG